MARCKDCIHEIVCSALIEKGLPWNDGEYPAEAFCMTFVNKADVVPKSEVAREIFEEIERETKNHGITYVQRKIAELKKKYTEGSNGRGQSKDN